MYLTFIAHISPWLFWWPMCGGNHLIGPILWVWEYFLGVKWGKKKGFIRKQCLGCNLVDIQRGQRKKNTHKKTIQSWWCTCWVEDGMIRYLSSYVVLELHASTHAMATMLKLQPQVIAHVLHNDKFFSSLPCCVCLPPSPFMIHLLCLHNLSVVPIHFLWIERFAIIDIYAQYVFWIPHLKPFVGGVWSHEIGMR